jgi:hypothetical protein
MGDELITTVNEATIRVSIKRVLDFKAGAPQIINDLTAALLFMKLQGAELEAHKDDPDYVPPGWKPVSD